MDKETNYQPWETDHVYSTAGFGYPVVVIKTLQGIDSDTLSEEITRTAHYARERYRQLSPQAKKWERDTYNRVNRTLGGQNNAY